MPSSPVLCFPPGPQRSRASLSLQPGQACATALLICGQHGQGSRPRWPALPLSCHFSLWISAQPLFALGQFVAIFIPTLRSTAFPTASPTSKAAFQGGGPRPCSSDIPPKSSLAWSPCADTSVHRPSRGPPAISHSGKEKKGAFPSHTGPRAGNQT